MNLRYYQKQAIDAFFNHASLNSGENPLIVLPTGTGKSLVNAEIVRIVVDQGARVLCITHQKELIKQNYNEFKELEPMSDVGIYSAGLKKRDTEHRIIFAGIQSVHSKAYYLGRFDLIIVDEAHLIPQKAEGTYRKFLSDCKQINKNIIILGLTATPYRMRGGMLTHGSDAIFQKIIHETPISELIDASHPFNLDKKQYLTRPVSKKTSNKADMRGVAKRAGDYVESEMEKRFMTDDLVERSVNEIIEQTENRSKVLIFTSGINHAHAVIDLLPLGYAGIITSKQTGKQNDQAIEDFSSGQIKYLVNVNVLTTGYNEKAIDCVVLLRKTLSPGLYVQMIGRGTRLFPGKEDFLVLDFGGNIDTHGPIDKIDVRNPEENKNREQGAPIRECPECMSILHISLKVCPDCGYVFPEPKRHEETASDSPIISQKKEPEIHEVSKVMYYRHKKDGKPDSMLVQYLCGEYDAFQEWVLLDHGGYPRQKAKDFLAMVCPKGLSVENVDEMLEAARNGFFRAPTHIRVDHNGKFPRITDYALPDDWPKSEDEIEKYNLKILEEIIPF